jgi:Uma2 family endonuclease
MSVTIQLPDSSVFVPDSVRGNLTAFREWAGDNDLPEKTRTDFYRGEVWIDMGREQVFTHGLLKTEIAYALTGLLKRTQKGYYFCNGILVTNIGADLSGNPDGTFVSHESIESGRVAFIEGKRGEGVVELLGTVDMVLEVVSTSSVRKDSETLRQAYWEAGVPEFWLVDARGDRLDFRILKRGSKGYTETRKQAGWLRSNAFDRSFRLTRKKDKSGHPTFALEVK